MILAQTLLSPLLLESITFCGMLLGTVDLDIVEALPSSLAEERVRPRLTPPVAWVGLQ